VTGFSPFTASHAATLAAGAAAIVILIFLGRRPGRPRLLATALLAFACLASYSLNQLAWAACSDPIDLDNSLPLHLCDIAAIVAGFALITRCRTLCELTYFWGLAASIQGIVTPAVGYDFPHPVFITFFWHHFAIVGAALFLPLGLGWRPRRPLVRTIIRVLLWSELYLVIMLPVNFLLGSNFGFLARKPANPTLLDHLGPWPWYILSLQFVGIVLLTLIALPFLRSTPDTRHPAPES
jgi:hypothetical integral membrane protein (TIGR02206 family)